MKKLSILCCERSVPSDAPSATSYRLPASHSRHGPARVPPPPAPAPAAVRADPASPQVTQNKVRRQAELGRGREADWSRDHTGAVPKRARGSED